MIKAPFKLPVQFTGKDVLIAKDHELICTTDGSTKAERDYIVKAVNFAPDMYNLLDHFRNNVSGGSDLDIELFANAVSELLARVEA